ncbi:MAG: efflux RND transporter periplasmic adaptor subunit [Candidatus Eiseniibacteriota bacterium]|nr:MAG: efflux RND transporter periplasmic adaptor subunit [Candidatus Eisenbacteria bacterium]
MKARRLYLVVAVVVVVVVAVVLLVRARGPGQASAAYRTAVVEKGQISIEVTATGTLNPLNTVQVGSQISGTVAELHADFNSRVRTGQLIALIDTTFLAASVKEAQAALERAQAEVRQAEMELQRAKVLAKKEIISELEYDLVATSYQTARATARSAEAQLERATVNLELASIRAPVDGVVISRSVDVGQTVAASFAAPTLFLIANDLKEMQLEAQIDEGDIGMMRPGQLVTFTVNAYADRVFEGVVSQVRLEPITVQDVVSYTIVVAVSNPDERLMPGMTANLNVHVDEKNDVLKVPNAALRFRPPGAPVPAGPQGGLPAGEQRVAQAGERSASATVEQRGGRPGAEQQGSEPPQQQMAQRGQSRGAQSGGEERGPQFGERSPTRPEGGQPGPEPGAQHAGMPPPPAMKVVWRLGRGGKLEPVQIRVGLTDGSFTEVLSPELAEGDVVVTGFSRNGSGEQRTPTNPFQPNFRRRGR